MSRDIFVDRLKGYACFLVVFGHVIMGIRVAGVDIPGFFHGVEDFVWSFHVALFLFLSGYVYKITGEWKSQKTKSGFIKHKALNLGVPYVVFSALYILINSLSGSANTQNSLNDILMIWKTPVAQYWFLYALFFLFVVWTVFSDTMKNWQITLFMVVFGYASPFFGVSMGCFDVVVYSALAFGLGTAIPDISGFKSLKPIIKALVIVMHLIFGVTTVIAGVTGYPVIKELLIVFGIFASILFISLIGELKLVSKFLEFMNKYSFQTYLLHTIFTAGIRIALLKVGIENWIVHVVLGLVLGIAVPVICAKIADYTGFLNIFFFPGKVLKKLGKKK